MPSLKDYRDRIASVKSTKKITSAMKMVAASKLKKAQNQAEASQPYAAKMASILNRLSQNIEQGPQTSSLMTGTGKDDVHLLVVMTSDRGLCGGFNTNAIRQATQKINSLKAEGKKAKLLLVGSKGYDGLKRLYHDMIIDRFPAMAGKHVNYEDAERIKNRILQLYQTGEFDVCTLIYNHFQSVIAQRPTLSQLIPFKPSEEATNDNTDDQNKEPKALYEFEPNEEVILDELLPQNLSVQIFGALLDSAAGEQASRMTAMDNATRNAGEMIGSLTLEYNRVRQAYITKELIEIISGAEAV